MKTCQLPDRIRRELEAVDDWEIREGGRHRHLFVAGKMVAVIPNGSKVRECYRSELNVRAQIRRRVREIQAQKSRPGCP